VADVNRLYVNWSSDRWEEFIRADKSSVSARTISLVRRDREEQIGLRPKA
jgi:hypothetical protein